MNEKIVYDFEHFGGLSPKWGGITIVINKLSNDEYAFKYSICSPRDQFCKKIGYLMAKSTEHATVIQFKPVNDRTFFPELMVKIYDEIYKLEREKPYSKRLKGIINGLLNHNMSLYSSKFAYRADRRPGLYDCYEQDYWDSCDK